MAHQQRTLSELQAGFDSARGADARAQYRYRARRLALKLGVPAPPWAAPLTVRREPRAAVSPSPASGFEPVPRAPKAPPLLCRPPEVPEALRRWRRDAPEGFSRAVRIRRAADRWYVVLVEWREGQRFEAAPVAERDALTAVESGAILWQPAANAA